MTRPRGALLLETAVTLTLLVALMTLAIPGLRRLQVLQQVSPNRGRALRACSAALTQIAHLPWGEIDESAADNPTIVKTVHANLPSGALKVDVAEASTGGKRITATVEWPLLSGGSTGQLNSVRLTTWRYRTEEAEP